MESKLHTTSKLITRTTPEIVSSFNHTGKNGKSNIAQQLLLKVAEIHKVCIFFGCRISNSLFKQFYSPTFFLQNENKLNEFAELVMAPLQIEEDGEADDTLISNSILVLHALLQNYTDQLKLTTLNDVLGHILIQLVTGSREKVKSAIIFVLTFIKILPASFVANQLKTIIGELSAMKPDTKRFFRRNLEFIYIRLCKRFSVKELKELVPGNDEITHRRLRNISKKLSKSKRQKASSDGDLEGNDLDEGNGS